MPRNDPVTAALGGTLAVGAALAAALGSRIAPSIFAFAALLLHTPLASADALRVLMTALIGAEAALRVADSRARRGYVSPGLALVLFWAAAAIAVTWSGGSPTLAANPVAAMATGP